MADRVICPACGRDNSASRLTCKSCRATLPKPGESGYQAASQAGASPSGASPSGASPSGAPSPAVPTAGAGTSSGDTLGEWGTFGARVTLYRNRIEYKPGVLQSTVIIPLRSIESVEHVSMTGSVEVRAGGKKYRLPIASGLRPMGRAREARDAIAAALP